MINQYGKKEYYFTAEQQAIVNRNINQTITAMELKGTNNSIPRNRTGSAALARNTQDDYEKVSLIFKEVLSWITIFLKFNW
jgi:hypothetical protein